MADSKGSGPAWWARRYDGGRPYEERPEDGEQPSECCVCGLGFLLSDGPDFGGCPGEDHPVVVEDPGETSGLNLAHASCAGTRPSAVQEEDAP
ncbi:MAG: hypothetical protein ABII00_16765 [Elusimicrobiota bacterium]